MASLSFPSNPVNGELYPANPPLGESQYQYDASANTWRLIGPASGAIAGTYGTPYQVPQITIDSSGRILVAQNIPIAATAGDLQMVTDNGNTTTNSINIEVTGASLGLLVVDGNALPNRVEIHPTYLAVRNGLIEVQEGGVPSISINPLGVPVITVRRGGYMTLGNGTSVYVETIRLNGQDGSAAFDGELIGNAVITNTSFEVDNGGPNPVARIADTGNFLPDLTIGNLTYAGTDNLPGYVLTTDGLGNLSLQPPSAVSASTLQAVTDNGNTTTNDIDLLAVGGFATVSLRASGQVAIPPQLPGEPGTYMDASSFSFGSSTGGSIYSGGLNPASIDFEGALGIGITTNGATNPVSLKPGGVSVFSVTGSATTVSNTLVASGLSYPTSDGTIGQVLTTDGAGNLGWRTAISTYGNLQEVTDQGSTTTNTILINGTSNPDYPLILISNASREAAEIRGRVSDGQSVLRFTSNDGIQTYGFLEGGATFLRLGAGAGTATVNITGTTSEITTPTTLSGGLLVTGNFSSGYQIQTAGTGGISVGDASSVIRASIQGTTGNIATQGTLEASGLKYPATDGAPGQVMSTDGNGNLGWGSQSTGNLQQVTDNGSTTTNVITVGGVTSTGTSNFQAPVNASSVQVSTLATLDSLGFGFQNVANTLAFNNNMVLCYSDDPVAGFGSRIIARGSDLIIGTQGGPGPVNYYSELIRVRQGDATLQPNTSSVSLGYGDGTFKLTTTGTGVSVTGSVVSQGLTVSGQANFQNDVVISPYNSGTGTNQILLGNTNQFRIYSDGVNAYFVNAVANTTGNLRLQSDALTLGGSDGLSTLGQFITGGAASLYYNNDLSLSTVSGGVSIPGNLSVVGSLTAGSNTFPNNQGATDQFLAADGSGGMQWVGAPTLDQVAQAGSTTSRTLTMGGLSITDTNLVSVAFIDDLGQAFFTDLTSVGTFSVSDLNYTRFVVDGSTGAVSIGTSDVGAGSSSVLNFYASGNLTPTATIAASNGNITTSGIVTTASLVASGLAYPLTDGTAGQVITTNGAGILSWGTPGTPTLQQVTNTGSTTTNTITVGGLIASGLTYPNTDGSSGQFLRTNGAGTLSWATPATPTLQQVTNTGATTTGSITTGGLSTTGTVSTGTLVASGLNYPTSDGAANQVLKTNGSGTLGWQSVPVIVSAPASSSSPGALGQIGFDTDYIYWHNGTQWVRAQGTTF